MKGLVEYAGVSVVALALWLLPRPLGWTPKQTGFALAATVGLSAWVIVRSQAAIREVDQQEVLDFQANQEQIEQTAHQAQLAAATARQQAQLVAAQQQQQLEMSAQRQQFQRELDEAVAAKDAELSQSLQARMNVLEAQYAYIEQQKQELERRIAEFEQQQQIAAQRPSVVEQAKAKVEEQKEMLTVGLDLAKAKLSMEHELGKHRAQLGMPDPQTAQSAAIAQIMSVLETQQQRLDQQLPGAAQTVNVRAKAMKRQTAPVGFTEPVYDPGWAEEPPAESDRYDDEVVID